MDRLERQGGRLALPGLELVYVWNGFNIIGKSPRLVEAMLELVNEEKERLKKANGKCSRGENLLSRWLLTMTRVAFQYKMWRDLDLMTTTVFRNQMNQTAGCTPFPGIPLSS